MLFFLTRILPLVCLALLIAGIVLIVRGNLRGCRRSVQIGAGCIVLFVLALITDVLMVFARL